MRKLILIFCGALMLAGCSKALFSPEATDAFSHAQGATLYSLDPSPLSPAQSASPGSFHGYRILGSTPIMPWQAQDAFKDIAKGAGEWNSDLAKTTLPCFNPRHGLRVEKGGHRYDLVVCYECAQVRVYRDNEEAEIQYMDIPAGTAYPKKLNDILGAAEVPGARH
jgi:hypothetical protein